MAWDSKIFAMAAIIAGYAIYACSNPGTDGLLFGTVMTVIGLLAGVKLKEGLTSVT